MNKQTPPKNVPELLELLAEQNVSKAEYQIHVDRFLDFKARSLGIPLHGHFELTPLCNLDCKMCYIHLSPSQFSP